MNNFLDKKIKKSTILAVVVALISASFIFKFFFLTSSIEAYEFIGQIKSVEGNYINANGIFVPTPDKPEFHELKYYRDVQIKVTEETKFEKTIFYMPTNEELKKTGGYWRFSELRQEVVEGSLDDLNDSNQHGRSVRILTSKNIFNKSSFRAEKVEYFVQLYPGQPPFNQ